MGFLKKKETYYLILLLILFCNICLLFFSCAPKKEYIPHKEPHISGEKMWKLFGETQATNSSSFRAFSLRASLNLFSPEGSHRISMKMWGNFILPLRIDLSAGFGTRFSLWKVTDQQWLAYYPKQQKAYLHPNSRSGAARLGFDSPFDLQELAFILTGQWPKLIPDQYQRYSFLSNKGWCFYFSQEEHHISSVVLDHKARVRSISGSKPYQWEIQFDNYESMEEFSLAKKIVLTTDKDQKVILNLKDIDFKEHKWSKSALKLNLPKDTIFLPLDSR